MKNKKLILWTICTTGAVFIALSAFIFGKAKNALPIMEANIEALADGEWEKSDCIKIQGFCRIANDLVYGIQLP